MRFLYKFVLVFVLTGLSAFAFADPAPKELLLEGRVDAAIALLQSAISGAPRNAAAQNLLCRAYFSLGRWDAGITACEKASSLEPNNADYHLWLGRIYGQKADSSNFVTAARLATKVRNELETAVRLNPNNAAARTDLAEFYMDAPGLMGGGKDKAAAQASMLAALDPAKAGWVRARLAEKNKDYVTAEKEYRAAVQASNGRADAWVNLGRFYRDHGRLQEMEAAIENAATNKLDRPADLMDAAEILIKANRNLPFAAELLRRYIAAGSFSEDQPGHKAHYVLGTVLEKQGDKQGAAQEYRAARGLANSFSLARDALNRLSSQSAGGL